MQLSSIDADVPLLNADLLAQLGSGWAKQGAPIGDHLASGLSEDEMDSCVGPLGLRLPLEARVWWGWHDGVPWRPDGAATPERALGPGLQYKPLRESVEDYLLDRRIFAEVEGDPEPFRPASYFPITRGTGPILCDCSVPEGAPTPIYYTHTHDSHPKDLREPVARSFGEMVSWWIDALRDGSWRWNPQRGAWDRDDERVSRPRDLSGLV